MGVVSYSRAIALHAERDPDGIAIVHEERTLSRAGLERAANRRARALAERGVARGDLVTLALPNGIPFLEWCFAVWKLGAVPNPISARLPAIERAAVLERAKPRLVIGIDPAEHPGFETLAAGSDPSGFDDAPLPDVVAPHRQALTSGGSTGTPKVIVDALPAELDPDEPFFGLEPRQTSLVPGPLYHAGPFLNCVMTLLLGGKAVVMSRFDPERTLALLAEHRIAFVNLVPTMLHRIWRLPEEVRNRYDLSALG